VKKVAVTVEFIASVPDGLDLQGIETRFLYNVGDVLRFEAQVNGQREVVATASEYETIGVELLDDVYQDEL
jgi:hypothetical protein